VIFISKYLTKLFYPLILYKNGELYFIVSFILIKMSFQNLSGHKMFVCSNVECVKKGFRVKRGL